MLCLLVWRRIRSPRRERAGAQLESHSFHRSQGMFTSYWVLIIPAISPSPLQFSILQVVELPPPLFRLPSHLVTHPALPVSPRSFPSLLPSAPPPLPSSHFPPPPGNCTAQTGGCIVFTDGTLELTDTTLEASIASEGHVLDIPPVSAEKIVMERLILLTRVSLLQTECLAGTMVQSSFAQLVMRELSFSPECDGGRGSEIFDVQPMPCGGTYADYTTGDLPVEHGVCSSGKAESCSTTPLGNTSAHTLQW